MSTKLAADPKQRAAMTWCERINGLAPEQRDDRDWHYVLLGEQIVREWESKNERASELLHFARLRRADRAQQERLV